MRNRAETVSIVLPGDYKKSWGGHPCNFRPRIARGSRFGRHPDKSTIPPTSVSL